MKGGEDWLKEVGFEVGRGRKHGLIGDLNLGWCWRVDVAGDLVKRKSGSWVWGRDR